MMNIKKILILVVALIVGGVLLVAVAGFIKFNILQDDIYVELPDGTVVPYDEYEILEQKEGIVPESMTEDEIILNNETVEQNKDLIVIAAPSVHNEYYKDNFQDIIDFDVAYANAVMGKDEIRIVVDKDTKSYFENRVPKDILIEADVEDIWMRDFTTVNPHNPVLFRYTPASFDDES
mgnify:CR=1 FL=1